MAAVAAAKLKKYKPKSHFFFGPTRDTGYLYLNRSSSNIFITLSDFNNKVIRCQTSGSSGLPASKRRRKTPTLLCKLWNVYSSI